MKIDFKNCNLFDYVSVLRCYRRCGYNHLAKNCENTLNCRKYGGEYDGRSCREETKNA